MPSSLEGMHSYQPMSPSAISLIVSINVFVPWILSEFASVNPSFFHVICVTGGLAFPVTVMVMVFPRSP